LPIHLAAELFPLMSPDELRVLGADIIKNGLTSPIVLWRASPEGQLQLLDGRNRCDAVELITGKPVEIDAPSIMAGEFLATDRVIVLDGRSVDPWVYVVSANIHRRHLTIEDKNRLIVELLKADPTKSNRQVAKVVGASHPHVAKVREKAERAGDVETVTTSVDTKGRKQPAKKARMEQSARSGSRSPQSSSRARPNKPQVVTRHQATAGWAAWSVDERRHFIDGIGSRDLAAAIPPSWDMVLVRADAGQIRRLNTRIAVLEAETRERDRTLQGADPADAGLDIPSFLRRNTLVATEPSDTAAFSGEQIASGELAATEARDDIALLPPRSSPKARSPRQRRGTLPRLPASREAA
jgi:DNA-binding Lrp family transcriptional regulator